VYSGGQHGKSDGILEEQEARLLPLIEKCGVQVYFAGHDHHQEHIRAARFVQVIEGAGGRETRPFTMRSGTGFSSEWGSSEYGFALVRVTASAMNISYYTCGARRVGTCVEARTVGVVNVLR
jgi:hypothetical protein